MINLLRVSDLYRQHSILQATFSFDLKRHAFKRLLDGKKLIPLWIRLGYSSNKITEIYTHISKNLLPRFKVH